MPRGVPSLGQAVTSAAEELTDAPSARHLGTVPQEVVNELMDEFPPPPWESDPKYFKHNSDARRFVKAPDNVELRWLNPKIVAVATMRDWVAVPAKGDSRFKLLNKAMAAPDNTVRRGSHDGDFLAWMPKAWVESRQRQKDLFNKKRTQSAVDRQEELKHQLARGSFHMVTVDSSKHPTHTIADGRSMQQQDP